MTRPLSFFVTCTGLSFPSQDCVIPCAINNIAESTVWKGLEQVSLSYYTFLLFLLYTNCFSVVRDEFILGFFTTLAAILLTKIDVLEIRLVVETQV